MDHHDPKSITKVSVPNCLTWTERATSIYVIRLVVFAAWRAHARETIITLPLQRVADVLHIEARFRTPALLKRIIKDAEYASRMCEIDDRGRELYYRPFQAIVFDGPCVAFHLSPFFCDRVLDGFDFTMAHYQDVLKISSAKATLLYLVICHLERFHNNQMLPLAELRERLGFIDPKTPAREVMQTIARATSHLQRTLPELHFNTERHLQGREVIGVSFTQIRSRPSKRH